MVVSRDYKYMCSDPGQELIKKDIKELKLNRVVVASCSPHLHEPTFRRAVEDAGLNRFLVQMANIREHVSWVTDDKGGAREGQGPSGRGRPPRRQPRAARSDSSCRSCPGRWSSAAALPGIQAALTLADAGKK